MLTAMQRVVPSVPLLAWALLTAMALCDKGDGHVVGAGWTGLHYLVDCYGHAVLGVNGPEYLSSACAILGLIYHVGNKLTAWIGRKEREREREREREKEGGRERARGRERDGEGGSV